MVSGEMKNWTKSWLDFNSANHTAAKKFICARLAPRQLQGNIHDWLILQSIGLICSKHFVSLDQ